MASRQVQWMAARSIVLMLIAAFWLSPAAAQRNEIVTIVDRIEKLLESGNYPAALETAKKLEATVKGKVGTNHPLYGVAIMLQAKAQGAQGRYNEAEALYVRALALLNGPKVDPSLIVNALDGLGGVYKEQGKYAEAEQSYKRAVTIVEKSAGPTSPEMAVIVNNLGIVVKQQGRFGEAEQLYRRALAIEEKTRGVADPHIALTLRNLGGTAHAQGKYLEAEQLYKRALAIREAGAGHASEVAIKHKHIPSV
jgi:tetratricopeptide (TPR) repeat protein